MIREVAYYIAACDCCGQDADYGDYAAWSDPGVAIEQAEADAVFVSVGDDLLCSDCWRWPEDMPGYDEATSTSDGPVRRHAAHPKLHSSQAES